MRIEEFLQKYNIETAPEGHEHSRPGWVNFDCPWCSKDWKHWRMGYGLSSGACSCWACGPHSTIKTLQEITGADYQKIKNDLSLVEKVGEIRKEPLERGKLSIPFKTNPIFETHKQYLSGRGYDPDELVRLWGIQGIGITRPPWSWRLFIPIVYQGEMVSWTTRSTYRGEVAADGISAHVPKLKRYMSAALHEEIYHHKYMLYGEDYVKHTIVVCEGPSDVWALGKGAVCTFGSAYTKQQRNKIAKYPIRVICYDNQQEAQKQANKLCDELSIFEGETYNIILTKKDPGDSPQEARQIRDQFLSRT